MGHNKVVGVTIAFEKDEFEKSKMKPFKFLAEQRMLSCHSDVRKMNESLYRVATMMQEESTRVFIK